VTSDRQVLANRRNALKSTGPKTAKGKAAVGANALKHGLTARILQSAPDARASALAALAVPLPGLEDERRVWAEAHSALKRAEGYRQRLMAQALSLLDAGPSPVDSGVIYRLIKDLGRLHRHERRLQGRLRRLEERPAAKRTGP